MLRSHCAGEQENPEYAEIKTSLHIGRVWNKMDSNFDTFWASLIKRHSGMDALSALKDKYKVTAKPVNEADIIRNLFTEAIKLFQEESRPYVSTFTFDKLQEFQDYDASGFKGFLKKECPVIRNGVNSKREAMKEWQMKFKNTSGQELLDIFMNLIDFAKDYEDRNRGNYSNFNKYDDFQVEHLDDDTEYRIQGVIGSGIKSTALFNLHPQLFPQLSRLTMYGMYFLSGNECFGLKSGSSEFLMIGDQYKNNDHNIKMDHNYWYPYGLVMHYTMEIYRKIKEKSEKLQVPINENYRYVYVNTYFREIWQTHSEHIATMMCTDEGD